MHPKLMRNAPIAIAILVLLFTTPAAIAASLLSREKASAVCLIGEAAVFLWQDQADQKYRNASTDTAALAAQAYAAKRCKGGLNLLTEGGSDLVFHSIRAIAISLYGETQKSGGETRYAGPGEMRDALAWAISRAAGIAAH